MEVCHTTDVLESPTLQRLRQFVRERSQAWRSGTPDFEQFERELHEQIMALERELLAADLSRYDVAAEQIEVAGVVYHPVWQDTETYLTAAGEVQVERHLYRPAGAQRPEYLPLGIARGHRGGLLAPRAQRGRPFL